MRATVSHQAPKVDAALPTEADLKSGANLYRENCALCHGLPNAKPSAISKGMYPHPPQFFRLDQPITSDVSQPYRPASPKAYWKVKNGVRLTGMPGFKNSLTEQQILQLSQFLGNAKNLPPAVVSVLDGQPDEQSCPATPTPAPQSHSASRRR
ncbi:MAG TPA: cytochrome c [Candidatus Angelobacter sp.]|nr:cytochrome c [Candidatus Angelobacter sp.]